MSFELLYDISESLVIAREDSLTFGGISIVFAGDFFQPPPAEETNLYSSLKTDPALTAE